jgi:hypothetical protein
MAARENQGLQIALIIFVMLTIVLIVTTYWFFRSYSDQRDLANHLSQDNNSKDAEMRKAISEAADYKLLITPAQDESLDAVKEAAGKELQAHGEGLPDSEKNYRGLVARLVTNLRKAETTNAELGAKVQELNDKLATNGEAAKAEVAQYTEKLTQAAADLEKQRKAYDAARAELTQQKEQQAANFGTSRQQDVQLQKKSSDQIAAMTGQLTRAEKLLDDLRNKESREEKANEYPDGKVTRVSQRARLVWLNVGRADGLRRQTSFVIVDPEDGNPITSKPKGQIEVVRLTDAHEAEARIVEDDLSNPIMPGDNIFSVAWDAGRSDHFALAGKMDIDGDGKSDLPRIRDLISLGGGIVDAEVADDGTRTGQMTINTKYLVLGERPDERSKNLDAYSAINEEAKTLGIKPIDVSEFIKYMGYKDEHKTVTLGRFAKPTDFKPRLPNDVQRVMPGSTTPKDLRRSPVTKQPSP